MTQPLTDEELAEWRKEIHIPDRIWATIDSRDREIAILQNAVENIANMEPILDRVDPIQYARRVDEIAQDALKKLRKTLRVDATEFRPIPEAEWQVGFRDATALTSMSEQDWIDIEEAE